MNTIYIPYFFLVIVFVLQSFFNILFWRSFNENIDRIRLTYAVNNASDMATEYLLEFSQETPYGNIYIDPNTVWYVYKYTMLRGLNLYSAENMNRVEYFFPVSIIAVADGYFLRIINREEVAYNSPIQGSDMSVPMSGKSEQWIYRFTQKIPYARTTTLETPTSGNIPELGPPSDVGLPDGRIGYTIPAGTIISDNLHGKNIIAYYPSSQKYIKYQVDGNKILSKEGTAHSVPEIGLELLKALDYSVYVNASATSVYKKGGTIQIPIEVTNNVAGDAVTQIGPEVLVMADQFDWIGNHAMSFFTISNTQIVENIPYYCYTFNYGDGSKKYYSTLVPSNGNTRPNYTTIEQIYTKQEQAALQGYQPDPYNFH